MKWMIPREHGAWSMWITPYLIGAFVTPWHWQKVIVFFALFFFYLSSAPLLAYVRHSAARRKDSPLPSLLVFGTVGLLLILYPVWSDPDILLYAFLALPFFVLNVYFAYRKKERLISNDLSAIIALSLSGPMAVHLGYGAYHPTGWLVWILSILYFFGTVFYVKSMIRERGNRMMKRTANGYHLLLVSVPLIWGKWWISVLYFPAAVKVWLTPFNSKWRPLVIGIIEIVSSVLFFALCVFFVNRLT
jgi:uncharacterized membrane protein